MEARKSASLCQPPAPSRNRSQGQTTMTFTLGQRGVLHLKIPLFVKMWESEGWGGYFYKEQKVSGRPNLLMLFSVEKVELNLPTLAYCVLFQ